MQGIRYALSKVWQCYPKLLTNRKQIRGQDGLLQRYLKKSKGKWTTRQGEMMRYWSFGHNTNFLLLLSLVSHAELCRNLLADQRVADENDEVKKAAMFLQPATEFFDGFEQEAELIWSLVASPFTKATKQEIRDFVADDDDEEEVVEGEEEPNPMSHSALRMAEELAEFDRAKSVDERRVARYEVMEQAQRMSYDNGDDYEDYGDSPDEEEQYNEYRETTRQGDDESSEEHIETRQTRRLTPKKRLLQDDVSSDNSNPDTNKNLSVSSKMRKRLVIADSDEE